ncbi:hypothetical protein D9M72_470020 [compost metagenome]
MRQPAHRAVVDGTHLPFELARAALHEDHRAAASRQALAVVLGHQRFHAPAPAVDHHRHQLRRRHPRAGLQQRIDVAQRAAVRRHQPQAQQLGVARAAFGVPAAGLLLGQHLLRRRAFFQAHGAARRARVGTGHHARLLALLRLAGRFERDQRLPRRHGRAIVRFHRRQPRRIR